MKLQTNKTIFQHARFHPRDVSGVSDSGPRARGGERLAVCSLFVSAQACTERSTAVHLLCFHAMLEVFRGSGEEECLANQQIKQDIRRCRARVLGPSASPSSRNPCHMTNLNVIYHQFQPSITVDPESSVGIKLGAIISMTCLSVLRGSLNIKESLISSNPAC